MNEKQECWLTTFDNPYDYFTQFDEWNRFDTDKGYNTCGYIARIAKTSSELSDVDYNLEVDRAIEEILKFNPLNIYVKVRRKEKEISNA